MAEQQPTGGQPERTDQPSAPVRSDSDAMDRDKRRQVVGQSYGPTKRKQLILYGAFLGVVVLLVIASLTVVDSIDNREIPLEDTAPWATSDVELDSPRPIDFPANGPLDTMPRDEIDPTGGAKVQPR